MKKIAVGSIVLTLFLSLANPASAGCVGPVVMGECLSGTSIPGYDSNSERNYQGSSGAQYQYDLSKPSDRNQYSIDLDAQRRDKMEAPYDAGRQLDQLQGQRGGGYRSNSKPGY